MKNGGDLPPSPPPQGGAGVGAPWPHGILPPVPEEREGQEGVQRYGLPEAGGSRPQPVQPRNDGGRKKGKSARTKGRLHQQQQQQPDPRIIPAGMAFPFSQQPLLPPSSPNLSQPQTQTLQQPQLEFQKQKQKHKHKQPHPQFQMQQPQLPVAYHQPMILFKADKSPASYKTKWQELHPDSQTCLIQIEARILQYINESQRLEQCSQLYNSSVINKGFELDATCIIQELRGISIAIDRKRNLVQVLMASAQEIMRNVEFSIRSFMSLHHRFIHPRTTGNSNVDIRSQNAEATSAFIAQPMANSVRIHDFYSGVRKRPSPFLTRTVDEFEKYLAECRHRIEELEQLLHVDTERPFSSSQTLLECLPSVLSNLYDYFICVAAKVENAHQYIESMKTAYLANWRWRGDVNNPFLEADRRETAKLEVAASRIHPILHLFDIPSHPSNQAANLFASSASRASIFPHRYLRNSGSSSGSGFSMFITPSAATSGSASRPSLFFSPSSSSRMSTFFGSSGFSPQSTPFGSTQTPSLFGASNPAFISTPAIGNYPLFSLPSFASGAATGSRAICGATSRAPKPRSRAPRR